MKILTIREAFELRLSLMMTLNNENPFHSTAKTSSSSPYWEFTMRFLGGTLLRTGVSSRKGRIRSSVAKIGSNDENLRKLEPQP